MTRLMVRFRILRPFIDERGANLVEYLLLVSLIAIAVIAAVVFLGGTVKGGFDGAGSGLQNIP
jgi:Flp pilus assembly pilin Flp